MTEDVHHVVSAGYDAVADAYLEQFGVSAVRQRWVSRLIDSLPTPGCRVLDLGCGAGIPVARDLIALGHVVVGVDGSGQQIARARQNVPGAIFLHADMCGAVFDANAFDAVGAFYSITHVPPDRQRALIADIARWLKPGGTLIASFGTGAAGTWKGKWLGTEMAFGHLDGAETLTCLAREGVLVRRCAVEKQDNEEVSFMWVEAVKNC